MPAIARASKPGQLSGRQLVDERLGFPLVCFGLPPGRCLDQAVGTFAALGLALEPAWAAFFEAGCARPVYRVRCHRGRRRSTNGCSIASDEHPQTSSDAVGRRDRDPGGCQYRTSGGDIILDGVVGRSEGVVPRAGWQGTTTRNRRSIPSRPGKYCRNRADRAPPSDGQSAACPSFNDLAAAMMGTLSLCPSYEAFLPSLEAL